MESMIYLSECKDEKVLRNFEKLKSNIPVYLKDQAECNPFIQYIESTGRISEKLLEFLYHSDFLSLITERTVLAAKTLYECDAGIEWFYLMQKIFEEFGDMADEYVEVIMNCFEWQEDVVIVEELLEMPEMSDVDAFRKKVVEYRKEVGEKDVDNPYRLSAEYTNVNAAGGESFPTLGSNAPLRGTGLESKYIALKEERDHLSEQYNEVVSKIQETYKIIQMYREQEQRMKSEMEVLKKNGVLKDRFISREKEKNVKLIVRIQKIEEANDGLWDEIVSLRKKLEEANEIIVNRQRQEEVEVTEDSDSGTITDDMDDDFDEMMAEEITEEVTVQDLEDSENEEDYSDVSFAYEEPVEEESEDIQETFEEEPQQEEPYVFTDLVEVVADKGVIKEKCKWFLENLFGYSKRNFLKKAREEQEYLIFMKMMELHFPMDYQKSVRTALTDLGDAVPCFDLYKLICSNPERDEVSSFLSEFQKKVADE